MNSEKREIFNKLYVKQWVLGLVRADIKDIIRTRTFKQDINWLPLNLTDHFYGDPFLLKTDDDNLNILFEDFDFEQNYGNLSLMTLDNNFRQTDQKVLLDTKSHLSYPFIFKENGKIFVFPESSRGRNLLCYEYDPVNRSLAFVGQIIDKPLLDSTILKHNNIYWIFATTNEKPAGYRMHIFYSDKLFGPYTPHHGNPVRYGYDGTRSAGNFINVDGIIYRPAQNCEKLYGESITINRIRHLDKYNFEEEPYMTISIDDRNREIHGIHTIHTINAIDGLIAVDGMKWTFSPKNQFRNFLRNKKHLKNHKIHQKAINDF